MRKEEKRGKGGRIGFVLDYTVFDILYVQIPALNKRPRTLATAALIGDLSLCFPFSGIRMTSTCPAWVRGLLAFPAMHTLVIVSPTYSGYKRRYFGRTSPFPEDGLIIDLLIQRVDFAFS